MCLVICGLRQPQVTSGDSGVLSWCAIWKPSQEAGSKAAESGIGRGSATCLSCSWLGISSSAPLPRFLLFSSSIMSFICPRFRLLPFVFKKYKTGNIYWGSLCAKQNFILILTATFWGRKKVSLLSDHSLSKCPSHMHRDAKAIEIGKYPLMNWKAICFLIKIPSPLSIGLGY